MYRYVDDSMEISSKVAAGIHLLRRPAVVVEAEGDPHIHIHSCVSSFHTYDRLHLLPDMHGYHNVMYVVLLCDGHSASRIRGSPVPELLYQYCGFPWGSFSTVRCANRGGCGQAIDMRQAVKGKYLSHQLLEQSIN